MRRRGVAFSRTLTFLLVVTVIGMITAPLAVPAATVFPQWSFHLKLWPFDILYPHTTLAEIDDRLAAAADAGANATIVYVEEEHMYGTFVDEVGFAGILQLLEHLVTAAHQRQLRVIVYLNGLEVMTHDAVDPATCAARSIPTMAREHPDWLQLDLEGQPVVYSCLDLEWVTPDMEDAWVSPFSAYRDLFIGRLQALGGIGVDAVYIDATFLPGLQTDEEELRWGTTDALARADFEARTGLVTPTEPDWEDPSWRAWLEWRHDAVAGYLADLADAAWGAGLVPFWESSSNDSPEGTVLGNETAVTARNTIGFSPEIEPEGDWLAAFRMAQAARDFAPDHPMIYLGWAAEERDAERELATALAFSGTLYPTADAPYPVDAFAFADTIRTPVLERRVPYWGHVALVYSVRNKDWSWQTGANFDAYDDAFRDLTRAHIPFRILVLEDLDAAALAPFETVVLPELASISDEEHALLREAQVVVLGEAGTRDGRWRLRTEALTWPNRLAIGPDELAPGLPFTLDAPETTFVAFFQDGEGGLHLFAVHDAPGGEIVLGHEGMLGVTVWRRGHAVETLRGGEVRVPILGELTVVHVSPVDGTVSDGSISLHVDEQMRLSVFRRLDDGALTMTHAAPAWAIVLDGHRVDDFALERVAEESISGVFGDGERTTFTGAGLGPDGSRLELQLEVELYPAFPGTALTRARFRNLGSSTYEVDEAWSSALVLDRQLVAPSQPPYSFKMLSMGTIWGNGEHDRIWDLGSGSEFDNYNGGDVSNPDFDRHWGGGGTPITSVWAPEGAITVAVVEPEIVLVGVPVITQGDGTVLLGVKQTVDLGQLGPGQALTTMTTSITVHSGDFFDGVEAYGRMMRDLGAISRTYSEVDYEAYWCSFGLDAWAGENPADRDLVDELLYIPEDLGLEWVNIDSGWDDTGSCSVDLDVFSSEQELVDWIADLHAGGFKVSLWLDIGFGDDDETAEHPEWFIRNSDGSYFEDDWGRNAMDPTLPEVQAFVEGCVRKLVTPQDGGGWGVDRFFVDGAFLPPPDYSGRHASPHETELSGDELYRIMYETAREIVPDFPVECCGSGGVYNLWIQRWATTASVSDPDRMQLRTNEVRTKLYKALFGTDAPVNGDHVEGTGTDQHLDMDYMFALQLGLGNIFQTFWWEDDWRSADPLGLGNKQLYQQWFERYDTLRLSQGAYLNLYDLGYDTPGSHAIRKGASTYYLFAPRYGQSFTGTVELRGLAADVWYEVLDYENGISWGVFPGPVINLDVEIPVNDPLLLQAVPRREPRRPSGRRGP